MYLLYLLIQFYVMGAAWCKAKHIGGRMEACFEKYGAILMDLLRFDLEDLGAGVIPELFDIGIAHW
jgi:hypothetical protein